MTSSTTDALVRENSPEIVVGTERPDVVSPATELRSRAVLDPDFEFIRSGAGKSHTFGSLDERSDAIATGLTSLGLSKGDRLAIVLPTCVEYIELIFACAKLGVIFVPLNIYLKGEFLAHQLVTSGATVIVGDAAAMRSVNNIEWAGRERPSAVRVLVGEPEDEATQGGLVAYESLAEHGSDVPAVDVAPNDLMSLMFTSGTTGLSKACKLSHAYYFQVARMYIAAEWVASGDRIMTALPLYHAGGQIAVLMSALFSRSSVTLVPTFSASNFMRQAHEEGATSIWGVAAMAAAVLAQPEAEDPDMHGQLRVAVWIPLDKDRQENFERRFGTRVVCDGYGQTEATAITLNPVSAPRQIGSLGFPASLIDVRIVDGMDNELAAGEVGEFAIRPLAPGAIFSGYWQNDAATVEATTNMWYHTGDYGRKRNDGAFEFVDRKRDALRRRGENVSSIELEASIRRHPLIDEVAVHGVPSAMAEDDIKACIVAKGEKPEPSELLEFFEQNLPYFGVPRYVEFIDSLPVNSVGRVLKHQLREVGIGADTIDLTGDRRTAGKDRRR
ncbi:coenzyme A ligase [Gordonia sp. KTR9]|nr:coenzyme A ligase [Gordonia sp. KTR9]